MADTADTVVELLMSAVSNATVAEFARGQAVHAIRHMLQLPRALLSQGCLGVAAYTRDSKPFPTQTKHQPTSDLQPIDHDYLTWFHLPSPIRSQPRDANKESEPTSATNNPVRQCAASAPPSTTADTGTNGSSDVSRLKHARRGHAECRLFRLGSTRSTFLVRSVGIGGGGRLGRSVGGGGIRRMVQMLRRSPRAAMPELGRTALRSAAMRLWFWRRGSRRKAN